jgi:hypothetical protein
MGHTRLMEISAATRENTQVVGGEEERGGDRVVNDWGGERGREAERL